MGNVVHLDHGFGAGTGHQRFGELMAVAVGEVQQAIGNARRAPVGRHVVEAGADQRLRLVAREGECHRGRAKNFEALRQRFGDEYQRAAVILALIRRPFGVTAIAPDLARRDADPERRADGRAAHCLRPRGQPSAGVEEQPLGADARARPLCLAHPAAGTRVIAGLGRHRILHPGPQHRLVHDAGVAALHPVVAPAQYLLQPADGGLNRHVMRVGMRPRADEAEPRHAETGKKPRHGFGVIVGPAGDGIDRNLDLREILADRSLLPVVVAALVAEPVDDPRLVLAHALAPHVAPGGAHDLGIGRQVIMGEHGGRPVEIILRQAAAHPVDVGGVAVVRRAHGDDGLECGRLAGGDLQAVEAAPRDADHRHLPVAPILGGDPGDGVAAVDLLTLGVFVVDQAFAVAGAANVEADRGIAVAGEVMVHGLVARPGAVTLAIGEIFENGGHRPGSLREPSARC